MAAPLIGYVIAFVASVIFSVIVLKLVIMNISKFYDYVNIIIFCVLIFGSFLFLMPKNIVSHSVYTTSQISCKCTGYLYQNDYNKCISLLLEKNAKVPKEGCFVQRDCYGIKHSCITFGEFKEKTLTDIEACATKNDFYAEPDSCYISAAREIAGKAAASVPPFSFDVAQNYCERINSGALKAECINYVGLLKGGGVLF